MLRAQAQFANTTPEIAGGADCALGAAVWRIESDHAAGPVVGGEGRFRMVADIRFDNRGDWLRIDPEEARTLGDTALLMRGWERWGPDCLTRLNADFAVAVWDAEERVLTLARDFLGQRPLFYHQNPARTAFASMPSGLLALPETPRSPDRQALSAYIAMEPWRGSRSFFNGIMRVQPGHFVRIGRQGVTETRFWEPERGALKLATAAEYGEAAREALDRAVKSRLRDAGAAGCHLSAGLDSGAVMASAALQLPQSARLTAFTATPPEGFAAEAPPGRFLDEAPLAARSAAPFANVDHVILRSESADPSSFWDRAFDLFQAPFANPCNLVWMAAINEEARRRELRTMLIGQVGNLSFSYSPGAHCANLLAAGELGKLWREFSAARRAGQTLRGFLTETLKPLAPAGLLRGHARLGGRSIALADHHFAAPGLPVRPDAFSDNVLLGQRARNSVEERIEALGWLDFGCWNKGVLAGWGLDSRDPTADRELIELCLRIPDSVFRCGGADRALARGMLTGRLPPEVLTERRRGYQAADWRRGVIDARWSLAEEAARSDRSIMAGDLIDIGAVERALAGLAGDGGPGKRDELRIRRGLLRALAAGHFIRKASGGNG